jgi:hypothetical protein
LEADEAKARPVTAFLEVGVIRNLLVHNDFLRAPFDKTPEEAVELYRTARGFPDLVGGLLERAVGSETT